MHAMKKYGRGHKVNLDSLNGGKKHIQQAKYTIYTDGSKKKKAQAVASLYLIKRCKYTNKVIKCLTTSRTTSNNPSMYLHGRQHEAKTKIH